MKKKKYQLNKNNNLNTNNINDIKIENIFLEKKRKIKKKLFFDEIKEENMDVNKIKLKKKFIGFKPSFKKNKNEKQYQNTINRNNDISPKDKIILTHLLLNSYSNVNIQEFLPEKTVPQRINSMREKIISVFPDITKIKQNNLILDENEDNRKKKI